MDHRAAHHHLRLPGIHPRPASLFQVKQLEENAHLTVTAFKTQIKRDGQHGTAAVNPTAELARQRFGHTAQPAL